MRPRKECFITIDYSQDERGWKLIGEHAENKLDLHGRGMFIHPDGDIYVQFWDKDNKHLFGTIGNYFGINPNEDYAKVG